MTREEIIALGKQAGFTAGDFASFTDLIVHFGMLVAAPLEERIQSLYEQLDEAEKQLDAHYQMGVEAEREACAKVADEWQTAIHDPRYECDCATAIRARGQA